MMTSLSYSHFWVGPYLGILFWVITTNDDAFHPKPVQIHVGDMLTRTNDDLWPYSFTSGQIGEPDRKFYSSITFTGTTFEHSLQKQAKY
jgi:hypothetical protein